MKDQGIEQLYPDPETATTEDPSHTAQPLNHAYYLLKISKSLLLNFLELVGILSVSPEQFEPKVEDMRNLFINAHHLLNLYRPHQARESLIMMMEEQLKRTKEEIQQMDKVKSEVEHVLDSLQTDGNQIGFPKQTEHDYAQSTDEGQSRLEDTRLIWDLLDKDN